MSKTLAEEVIRRQSQMAESRALWDSHWEEVAERVLPRERGFLGQRADGEKRHAKVYDSTAVMGVERFASAMESMLTPRGSRWHHLRLAKAALNEEPEVQDWLQRAEDMLFAARYSPTANFASQFYEAYLSLGAFGTGIVFVSEAPGQGLMYRALHLGECYLAEDQNGRVDTLYRKYQLSARQARQRFGEEGLPRAIANAADKEPERRFDFIHATFPREDRVLGRLDSQSLAYASVHVVMEGRQVVKQSGFHEFPYSILRYVNAPREVYGRSPAMQVLADIKMLNEMEKTIIRQAHKAVDPPILLHDDGVMSRRPDIRPNALNYGMVDRDGRPLMQPFQTGSNLPLGLELSNQKRQTINDAFLVTLFQILVDSPQMTATEVLERAREKGALLSPTIGRQQSEGLGPLIEREIGLMDRAGTLPSFPEGFGEGEGALSIEYDSPLTRTQRADEGASILRTIEMLGPVARLDPSVFDNFDADRIARLAARVNGVETLLRPRDVVEKLRSEGKQKAGAQGALAAAGAIGKAGPGLAALAKGAPDIQKALAGVLPNQAGQLPQTPAPQELAPKSEGQAVESPPNPSEVTTAAPDGQASGQTGGESANQNDTLVQGAFEAQSAAQKAEASDAR